MLDVPPGLRSELREMNGSEKASWSNTSGTHVFDVRDMAELLSEFAQEEDPHPLLFDAAVETLRQLGAQPPLVGAAKASMRPGQSRSVLPAAAAREISVSGTGSSVRQITLMA